MRIAALLCIALATVLQARVRVEWTAESSKAKAAEFQCYRGETLELAPAFTEYGVSGSNYSASVYWQTNGMGMAWWYTNELVFAPSMDVGAASYTLFVRAAMSNGVSYRANAIIRMLNSPGSIPNSIPLPVQRIDFAAILYANSPWLESASWLEWLSTNTFLKVESDPGIPSAIATAVAQAGTNAQAITDIAVLLARNYTLTNHVAQLWSNDRFIDGLGNCYVVSNFWEMTFSNGFRTQDNINIPPALELYTFTSPSQSFFERPGGQFSPYWRLDIGGVEHYPGGFYNRQWYPTTNSLVFDPVLITGAQGYVYVRPYSTTNLISTLASQADVISTTAGKVSTNETRHVRFNTLTLGGVTKSAWPAESSGVPAVWTNMTWGAVGTNVTYQMSWDVTNGTKTSRFLAH